MIFWSIIMAMKEQEKAKHRIEEMSRGLEQTFIQVGQNTNHLVTVTLKEMDARTKQNAVNAGQANHLMKEVGKVTTQADYAMKDLTLFTADITKASVYTPRSSKQSMKSPFRQICWP